MLGKRRDKDSRLGVESVPKFSSDNSNNSSSKTLQKRDSFSNLLGKTKNRKSQYQLIDNDPSSSFLGIP